MTKTDENFMGLQKLLENVPQRSYFKVHGSYQLVVPRGWKQTEQINEDMHLLFVRKGSGTYFFEGREESLHRSKIVFVSSGLKHFAWHDEKDPLHISALRFGLYEHDTQKMSKQLANPFFAAIMPGDIEKYERLFNELNEIYHTGNDMIHRLYCNTLICQIISLMYMELSGILKIDMKDNRIEEVKSMIECNVIDRISTDEMAKKVGLSQRHMRELFKKKYSMTPKNYQLKLKMNYAKFVLENSSQNIKEVAALVGYSDQYVFSRQFKQQFGLAPSRIKR